MTKYTRVVRHSKTIIDLVFTNSQNVKASVLTTDQIADHRTVVINDDDEK